MPLSFNLSGLVVLDGFNVFPVMSYDATHTRMVPCSEFIWARELDKETRLSLGQEIRRY